jgi:hypothetical protein
MLGVMVCVVTLTVAQTHEIDSLQNVVKNSAGLKKLDALNELSFRLLLVDFAKAKETLVQSKALAGQLNNKRAFRRQLFFREFMKI